MSDTTTNQANPVEQVSKRGHYSRIEAKEFLDECSEVLRILKDEGKALPRREIQLLGMWTEEQTLRRIRELLDSGKLERIESDDGRVPLYQPTWREHFDDE